MPQSYDHPDLQFLYPDNWKLTSTPEEMGPHSVYLQAPSGAFWSADLHYGRYDSQVLAAEVLNSMKGEYTDLEFDSISVEIAGHAAEGYEINFYCLDLIVTSRVLAFRHEKGTLTIQFQAENREFDELEAVFLAICTSLFLESNADS